MAIKKTLTGKDFIESPSCEERDIEYLPKTIFEQVQVSESVETNLKEWILGGTTDTSVSANLYTWLTLHNAGSGYTLPKATTSVLGGIMVGSYLSIDSTGILSVDKDALNIPESNSSATFSTLGLSRLGNSTNITTTLQDIAISDETLIIPTFGGESYVFPTRVDTSNHLGVVIPKTLFNDYSAGNFISIDSNTINGKGWILDYLPKHFDLSGYSTSSINYILLGNNYKLSSEGLGNLPSPSGVIEAGKGSIALVAGEGIGFDITDGSNATFEKVKEIHIKNLGTGSIFSNTTNGLVPKTNGVTGFLKSDGTWSYPSDTQTFYSLITDAIPSAETISKFIEDYSTVQITYTNPVSNTELTSLLNIVSTCLNSATNKSLTIEFYVAETITISSSFSSIVFFGDISNDERKITTGTNGGMVKLECRTHSGIINEITNPIIIKSEISI